MDQNKPMSIDDALDGKHLVGAVGYKRVGPMLFVLAYQHGPKDGVHYGTKQIRCYEFELNCLALDRRSPPAPGTDHRRPVHGVIVHRDPIVGPERPRRFAQVDPADVRG
jgi:hypothetical protein